MSTYESIMFYLLPVYSVYLLWRGFGNFSGLFTWHMFAGVRNTHFNIYFEDDKEQKRINIWEYIPHTKISIGSNEAIFVIRYIEYKTKRRIKGAYTSRDGSKVVTYKISKGKTA